MFKVLSETGACSEEQHCGAWHWTVLPRAVGSALPPTLQTLLNYTLWLESAMCFQEQDLHGMDLLLQAHIPLSKDPVQTR